MRGDELLILISTKKLTGEQPLETVKRSSMSAWAEITGHSLKQHNLEIAWRGAGDRCAVLFFQLDFLLSVAMAPVVIRHRSAFAGTWKPLERLFRVREVSETWSPQWWQESQLTSWNFAGSTCGLSRGDMATSAPKRTIFYTPSKWADFGRLWRFGTH